MVVVSVVNGQEMHGFVIKFAATPCADPWMDFQGLLPGYSADTEVILQRKEGVLRISAEAVSADHQVFVFHPENGLLEERPVKTGLANWEFIEIESGLQEGERIVLYARLLPVGPFHETLHVGEFTQEVSKKI